MAKQVKRWAVPVSLLAILVITRVPFLSNTLVGEEGVLAAFVVSEEPLSKQASDGLPRILIGAIDRKPVLIPAERTIVPYMIIERFGRILGSQDTQQSFEERSRSARLPFLCFFLLGVAGVLASIGSVFSTGEARNAWALVLVVVFALTTPLAVGSSIQPQIDGSLGVMLLGLAAWLLISTNENKFTLPCYIIAGVLIGLGKHEWAIAFLASAAFTLALDKLFGTKARRKCISFAGGVLLGIAISVLISIDDYVSGFHLMNRIYLSEHKDLRALWAHQIGFLWPIILLLVAVALVLGKNLRHCIENKTGAPLIVLGGIFIFIGFSFSGWQGDGFPRYFTPSLVLALYGLIAVVQDRTWVISKKALASIMVIMGLGIFLNVIELKNSYLKNVSISSYPGLSLSEFDKRFKHDAALAGVRSGVIFEDPAVWIYSPSVEFISNTLDLENAKQRLSLLSGEKRQLIVQ